MKSRFPDPTSIPHDDVLDVLSSPTPKTARRPLEPVTFVGRAAQHVSAGELQQRVKELEDERNSGGVILKLDPKQVGHSELANRDERSLQLSDPSFQRLYESIKTAGQDTPIVVRPAPPGSPHQYVIVEGHRRHSVGLLLDRETEGGWWVDARISVQAQDTKVHWLRMHRENYDRENLSPYEQGRMYMSALASGLFSSQEDLAKEIQVSRVLVLKYIQLASLPAEILVAFGDPRSIALRWGQELLRAHKANEAAVVAVSVQLANSDPRPSPPDVFRSLVKAGAPPVRKAQTREEAIKIAGQVAFRITSREGKLSLRFGKKVDRKLQRELLEEIKALTEKRIKEARSP